MKSGQIPALPVSSVEYDSDNEQTMRRSVEQYMSDLRGDIEDIQDQTSKPASLAMKRHQFLLMGA